MAGVLHGVQVLDLSWGIAGPMTTMLLADHGADVIKIEPPGGDPFRSQLGYKAWQRGKKSAVLDLKSRADLEAFLALAAAADILVESYAPGTTAALGIDFQTLSRHNPRLIYVSITAYGRDTKDAQRPGYDALVAARTGLQWEQRGWPEGAVNHMLGRPDPYSDIDIPDDWVQGAPRPGPIFTASHWPSLGAFFAASTGLNAALRAREITGRGQWVETSLLQGALAGGSGTWQRVENPDAQGFNSWILGSKSPKGHFQCADGRWVHNWVPNPRFIITASAGDKINSSPNLTVQNDPDRFGIGPEELLVMAHYQPILAECVKKFPCKDWIDAAAIAEMTMQECRPVEDALSDPLMLADGCVAEIEDPDFGRIRQVGITYKLDTSPGHIRGPAPAAGAHTAEIRTAAATLASRAQSAAQGGRPLKAPLDGIRVLDLGLAIAGPYGTQVLSDLGAEVIKINALWDVYWHNTHIAYMANRGKRSIALNLKDPRAKDIVLALVKTADVVQHNMRYDAAERLGVDYESLKALNPKLIYCHSRGHEKGPRERLPGNDQTGACLAGVQHEDGGMSRGGKPFWSLTSFGDTGNGFLSAIGILQALYHRDRTGEGQFVDTAIVNACLLNTSYAMARPDGSALPRPRLDGMQMGLSAGCRLYRAIDGWLCLVLAKEHHWPALFRTLDLAADDPRFLDEEARLSNDDALCRLLEEAFAKRPAQAVFEALDRAGVPCEISSPTISRQLFDNAEFKARQWTTSYRHPLVGQLDQIGLLFQMSDTPGVIQGAPLVVGDQTEALLNELGYAPEQIDALCNEHVVSVWPPRAGQSQMRSPWQAASE